MRGMAFCPAHVTGFFKAETGERDPRKLGSLGAGFSMREGVVTGVRASPSSKAGHRIYISGYRPDDTRVSECVIGEFFKMTGKKYFVDIEHEISVPVGYGLGCSGAVALSLAMALDSALGTGLSREEVGQVAHCAELGCKTGLGDVLASYHGGFEIRTRPGAPGIGRLEKIESDRRAILICFSPISTRKFMDERMELINGLGGKMVSRLARSRSYDDFHDMSLEFARYVKVMTPKMNSVIGELRDISVRCGVALFGETVFTLVPKEMEGVVLEVLRGYPEGIVINSEIDNDGATVQSWK